MERENKSHPRLDDLDDPIANGDRVFFKGEEFVVIRNRPDSEHLLGEVILFKDAGKDGAKVVFLGSTRGLKRIFKKRLYE